MGVEAIVAQDPLDSVGDTYPTFARNPRIACLVPGLRQALLRGFKVWRVTRRKALELWRAGRRNVLFPAGTYWHHVFYGAEVEAATGPPLAV